MIPDNGRVTPTIEVRDNPAELRYEAWLDGRLAGFSEYEPHDGWLVFHHTEVGPEYEGKGVGSRLAQGRARRRPGAWPQGDADLPVHLGVDPPARGLPGHGRGRARHRAATGHGPAGPERRPRASLAAGSAALAAIYAPGSY